MSEVCPKCGAAKKTGPGYYVPNFECGSNVEPFEEIDFNQTPECRIAELTDIVLNMIHDIEDLASNSEGIAGLHKNGDVATWDDLIDGHMKLWLLGLSRAKESVERKWQV